MKQLLLLLLSFLPFFSFAKDYDAGFGSVTGKVTTADNQPASLVTVVLVVTKKSTTTTEDGRFTLSHVLIGTYQLRVSLVGYESVSQTVTVTDANTVATDFILTLSQAQLEAVTVISNRNKYKVITRVLI